MSVSSTNANPHMLKNSFFNDEVNFAPYPFSFNISSSGELTSAHIGAVPKWYSRAPIPMKPVQNYTRSAITSGGAEVGVKAA